jgi:uncharacterized membrane protein YbaN (DUF454 family)
MTRDAPPVEPRRGVASRAGWVCLGCVAVGLGGIGIVVPGLPTTVFFIVAAWAFSKSSPRLEAWVLGLPQIGPMVRDYRAGLGMPKKAKVVAITMIVLFVGLSAWALDGWLLSSLVVAAGAIGVLVVLRVPTSSAAAVR